MVQTTEEGKERVLMGRWGSQYNYGELLALPKPEPRGSRHNPLPFYHHVNIVNEAAKSQDFKVESPCYYLNQSETAMIMTMTLIHPTIKPKKESDYLTAVLKTSNNSSWATEMLGGFGTSFCTNGLIHADHRFTRKNTTNSFDSIRLATLDLINKLPTIVDEMDNRWSHYDQHDLSSRAQAHDVLVESALQEVINFRDIPHVLEHWKNPEHPEFKERHLGNMVQAFTSHQRTKSPFELSDFSGRLTTFMDKYSGHITVKELPNDHEAPSEVGNLWQRMLAPRT